MRRLLLAVLALLALAPTTASAAPAVSGEFPTGAGTLSDSPKYLTLGSDGNIWVAEGAKIAKVTPGGTVTEFSPPDLAANGAVGITTGPDKNLWVTHNGGVVKIPPSAPNTDTPYAIAGITDPRGITTGPDNNLWTASVNNVFKIPPGTPTTATPFAVVTGARGIARGNNGQLWVADFGGHRIVSVTTAGAPTSYNTAPTGGPMEVAAGPGTQMGFTDPIVNPQEIGRITPGGSAQRTVVTGGSGDPTGVVFGNDGAYWIARFGANDLVRFTPTGQQTKLTGFSAAAGPRQIAKGPGDTLWVSLETKKKVARITGVSAPSGGGGGGGGGGGADTIPPVVTRLTVSPKISRIGSLLPQLSRTVRRRIPVGTRISFVLSEPAQVTLSFVQYANGRRNGRRCVRNRRTGRRCRITYVRGKLIVSGKSGLNKLRFQGRITRRKKLAPGTYSLIVSAKDPSGNVSRTRSTTLTLRR
jgi:streptogramin lyase